MADRELQVMPDRLEIWDRSVNLGLQALQDQLDLEERREMDWLLVTTTWLLMDMNHVARQDHRDHLGLQEHRVYQDQEGLQESEAPGVLQEHQEPPVCQGQPGHPGPRVRGVSLELPGYQEYRVEVCPTMKFDKFVSKYYENKWKTL